MWQIYARTNFQNLKKAFQTIHHSIRHTKFPFHFPSVFADVFLFRSIRTELKPITAGSVAAKSSSSCDSTSDNYGTEFFKVRNSPLDRKILKWEPQGKPFNFSLFLPVPSLNFHLSSAPPQDCCEACKIGLVIGSTSQQCSTDGFSFGSPWDDIIEDCCSDIRDGDGGEDVSEESKWFHVTIWHSSSSLL